MPKFPSSIQDLAGMMPKPPSPPKPPAMPKTPSAVPKTPAGTMIGRTDPDVTFTFFVEVDGIRCVKFTEARGLEWKSETVSFYEGGNPSYKVNLVGPGSFTPLTLKKGFFAADSEFFKWFQAIMNAGRSPVKRVTVSIVVLNRAGEEVGRYNLYGAYMSKYTGPGFSATENAIAFEEIEITYDYFEYAPGKTAGAVQSGMAANQK